MGLRTFFANEAVIPVVGVVCVPCDGATSIAYNSEVELCRKNAVSHPRGGGRGGGRGVGGRKARRGREEQKAMATHPGTHGQSGQSGQSSIGCRRARWRTTWRGEVCTVDTRRVPVANLDQQALVILTRRAVASGDGGRQAGGRYLGAEVGTIVCSANKQSSMATCPKRRRVGSRQVMWGHVGREAVTGGQLSHRLRDIAQAWPDLWVPVVTCPGTYQISQRWPEPPNFPAPGCRACVSATVSLLPAAASLGR